MLGKLLKYDLKFVYKVVLIFYVLAFIFSIFTRICFSVDNSMLFSILANVMSGITISMLVSSLINGFMRSWVRLVTNVYKDESYLTHTIPVEKKQIYLSKVLTAIICSFTTVIVALICVFIAYYSQANLDLLKQFFEIVASTYNTTILSLVLVISFIVFLEILFIILVGYAGIIIGHRSNRNKILKSIIIGFVLYMVTSAMMLGLFYIVALFNEDVMNLINTTKMANVETIKTIMISGIVIYSICNVIYYIIGKRQLEKGVNVD